MRIIIPKNEISIYSDYNNIKYIASFLNHLKRLHLWRAICIVHRPGREWRQTFIRDFQTLVLNIRKKVVNNEGLFRI